MHIVQFILTRVDGGRTPASQSEASLIEDILWAHAGTIGGMQHIRVRGGSGGAELSLLLAESVSDPVREAVEFVNASVLASDYLKQWRFLRPG